MNAKMKLMLIAAVLGVVLAGGGVLYQNLNQSYETELSSEQADANSGKAGGSSTSQSEGSTEAEKLKAPDFTVTDSEGKLVSLSDYQGKTVVINVWASWCTYCKEEMPVFQKAWEEIGDNVQFMMVNATDGSRETEKKAKKFIKNKKYSFPVFYDFEQDVSYQYGIASLPTTFVIDKEGYFVTGVKGKIDAEYLKGMIEMAEENN